MYKIINSLAAIDSSPFLHLQNTCIRGHGMMYIKPYCRSQTLRESFFTTAIYIWNQLPATLEASDQSSYHQPLNHYMPVYHFKAQITLPHTCTNSCCWDHANILRPCTIQAEEEVISTKDIRAMCVVMF